MSNSLKCNVKNVRVLFELKRSRRVMFLQTSRTFWLVFLYPQCVSVTDSCNALMFILHSVGAGVHIRHTFLDIAPLHTIHCTCRLRNLNRRCVLCYKQQVITCTSNPRQTFISFSILLLFSSFSRLPMHIICVCVSHTHSSSFIFRFSPSSPEAIPVLMFEVNISPNFQKTPVLWLTTLWKVIPRAHKQQAPGVYYYSLFSVEKTSVLI